MEILRQPAQWTARLGPVFLFLWTILGGLSAPCWAADASPADKLKSRLVFEIDDLRINVDVTPADNRLVVTLRGDVDTDGEKRRILTQADGVVADSAKIRDRIFVKSPGESEAPEPETTDLWVLTYIRSRVASASGDGTLTTAAPDSVDTLVQTLNSVYGQPIVRRAGGGRLFLHGKQSQVLAVKRFLSLIDSPWPQVQMNLWAIQVSGSPDEVARRTQAIGDQIRAVRDRMEDVQRELAHIVVRTDDPKDPEWWKNLDNEFETAGIELHAKGSLSLNESLLLLVLHPRRDQKVKALQAFIQAQCAAWECQESHLHTLSPARRHPQGQLRRRPGELPRLSQRPLLLQGQGPLDPPSRRAEEPGAHGSNRRPRAQGRHRRVLRRHERPLSRSAPPPGPEGGHGSEKGGRRGARRPDPHRRHQRTGSRPGTGDGLLRRVGAPQAVRQGAAGLRVSGERIGGRHAEGQADGGEQGPGRPLRRPGARAGGGPLRGHRAGLHESGARHRAERPPHGPARRRRRPADRGRPVRRRLDSAWTRGERTSGARRRRPASPATTSTPTPW